MWNSFRYRWRSCRRILVFYSSRSNSIRLPVVHTHVLLDGGKSNGNLFVHPNYRFYCDWISEKRFNRSVPEQPEDDDDDDILLANDKITREKTAKYKLAVEHETVVSLLNSCTSLQEQVEKFSQMMKTSEKELTERLQLGKYLEEALSPYFPGCQILLVGSSVTGFGLKGCDIDFSFITNWDPSLRVPVYTVNNLPQVEDIDVGRKSLSELQKFSPRLQMRFVRRVLREHCVDICKEPIYCTRGRCPIVQFTCEQQTTTTSCDISFTNRESYNSTKLLFICGKMDERVTSLVKIINYWAKHKSLIGAHKFKSYTLSLMTLYFLQTRSPPILPPLQEILDSDIYKHADMFSPDIVNDIQQKIPKSENTQTVEELLREFFFFYLYFDFDLVICPVVAKAIPKKNFPEEFNVDMNKFKLTPITVQDPLQLAWNTATNSQYSCCRDLLKQVYAACELYQMHHVWVPQNTNHWGLASLLNHCLERKRKKSPSEEKPAFVNIPVDMSNNSTNSLQLQFQKVSDTVLEVITNGLLFECTVLNEVKSPADKPSENYYVRKSESNDSMLKELKTCLRKVKCVTCNSWQGRLFQKSQNSFSNLLEAERAISLELLKVKNPQPACEFLCEFFPYEENGSHFLRLNLIPKKNSAFPSLLEIFLKEYLPNIVQKISK